MVVVVGFPQRVRDTNRCCPPLPPPPSTTSSFLCLVEVKNPESLAHRARSQHKMGLLSGGKGAMKHLPVVPQRPVGLSD